MVENTSKVYDELNVHQNSQLNSFVASDEHVLFSGIVKKINKHRAEQERVMVITNKFLYNICLGGNILNSLQKWLSPNSALKRKIDVKKVSEITLSIHPKSEQFIIHIDGDYDYRYNPIGKRDQIIETICNLHFSFDKRPFTFYLKEVEDLANFHTTDDDFKALVIKKPNTGKVSVTKHLLDRGLDFIIANRNNFMIEDGDNELYRTHSAVLDSKKESGGLHFSHANTQPFEPSKPIHTIEDIPMTDSGYVPRSSVQRQENLANPMLQPFTAKK